MDSPKNEQPQTSVELPITPPPAIKKPNSPGKVISIVALLITLATAGAIFFIWQQLKHHQEQYNQQINHLEINLSHANELLNQQEQALAASQKQFQSLLDEQNAQKQGGYVLLEVKYLVRLAEFHLMFENNALLARQLLETADQRVATDKTSALWPLRQAFAQDIAMLDATPTVDLPGLVARLQTVSQQAEELPQTPITLAEKEVASAQTAEVTTSAEGEHTKTVHLFLDKLKKFTYAVGNTLSTMVIVSKDSKSIPTMW
jgi:uroporphyrin-3 C-methyltransferase